MVDTVSNIISDKIQALNLVNNWGGLTKLVCKSVCVNEELGIFKDQFFPVTCKAESNCYDAGCYMPIVPGSCQSLAYLEAEQLKFVKCHGPKGMFVDYEFNLRLVFWLNLAEYGIEGCENSDHLAICIANALAGQCIMPDPYVGGAFTLEFPSITKDPKAIFGRYSYFDQIKKAVLYPNDFFALDWKVKITINRGCLTPESLNCQAPEVVECIPV